MTIFTAKDRQMIRLTAENYPISEYYKTDEMLTSLGIGEAAITALNEKGIPTPLAATLLRAPQSRMDILSESEIDSIPKFGKGRCILAIDGLSNVSMQVQLSEEEKLIFKGGM